MSIGEKNGRVTVSIDEEGNAVEVVVNDFAYRDAWPNFGRELFVAAAWICAAKLARITEETTANIVHPGQVGLASTKDWFSNSLKCIF